MSPSWQARAVAAIAGAVPDRVVARTLAKPSRRRELMPLVAPSVAERYEVDVTEIGAGRVATARPRSAGSSRHAFYLHGGAYTLGLTHWSVAEPLLERGWTVSLVDYPLAPEHTVAETVPMVLDAWRSVTDGASGPVDVLGDSAGGGLALVVLQQIRDLTLTRAGRAVLFSPWIDLVMSDPVTIESARHDPVLSLPGLRGAADLYAAGRDLADPLLSPIFGDLSGLGPVQVWVGTREMFLAQCCQLADLAAAEGVDGTEVDLRIAAGMIHDWSMLPIPEGRASLEEAIRFLG